MHSPRKPRDRKTVTVKQAMEIANVGRRTIFGWLKDGKIDSIRIAGGHRRIYVDSLSRGRAVNVRKISEEKLAQIIAECSHESFIEHRVEIGAHRASLNPALHRHDLERAERVIRRMKKLGYSFPLRSHRPK